MPMQFCEDHGALVGCLNGETLRIEAWGKDSLRVRSTMLPEIQKPDWALTEKVPAEKTAVSIGEADHWVGDGTIDKKPIASIENGRIRAVVNFAGVITFYRDGKQLLQEYFRFYEGTVSKESRCLKITSLEGKPLPQDYEPRVEGDHRRGRIKPEGQIRGNSRRKDLRYGAVSAAIS